MKIWFGLLVSLLTISNFWALYYLDESTDRWFRFGATFIFLLIYYFKYFSRYRILLIFLFFTLCDLFLVFYEMDEIKYLIYLSRIIAYTLLILHVKPSLSRLSLNLFSVVVTVFIVVIDIYLLNEMAESLPGNERNFTFLTLFYTLGILSVALAATSLSYLNRYADKKSFLLVLGSFGCILSDIFFYNSNYLGFTEFSYLDRLINIVAIAALVSFSREFSLKSEKVTEIQSA